MSWLVAPRRCRDCATACRPHRGTYRSSGRCSAVRRYAAPAQSPYERMAPAGRQEARAVQRMMEERNWRPRSSRRRLQASVCGRQAHGKCFLCRSQPKSATSCTPPAEGSAPGRAVELIAQHRRAAPHARCRRRLKSGRRTCLAQAYSSSSFAARPTRERRGRPPRADHAMQPLWFHSPSLVVFHRDERNPSGHNGPLHRG